MPGGPILLTAVLSVLLQTLVLDRLLLWGVHPFLLPALVFLIGVRKGADQGAAAGLLTGALRFLTGGPPWMIVLLSLTGGLSGALFYPTRGFWSGWLRFLPIAAGAEGLLVLLHWPARSAMSAAFSLACPELLLLLLCYPPAALLGRACLRDPGALTRH